MKVHREKNAPDFLIVGAAKSGTTSLWYYLDQHPEIFMNQGLKELGYFSDHYGINDYDDYLKYFDTAKSEQIIGEACHAYLSSEESAKKIYNFNPKMKIIIILRNPVDRAYSLYNWMVEHGHEDTASFDEALRLEDVRIKDKDFVESNDFFYMNYLYVHSGLYYEQVKRYYDLFPKENIHLIIYEEFRRDNLACLRNIFKFLNRSLDVNINLEKQNESRMIKDAKMHYFLQHRFTSVADKYFIPRRISNKLKVLLVKRNETNSKPKSLSPEYRKVLLERFSEDIVKLSDLIQCDLKRFWC